MLSQMYGCVSKLYKKMTPCWGKWHVSSILSVHWSDEGWWPRFVGTRLRSHMRQSGLVNIKETAAGVWVSGDLELKGALCLSLGGSQHFTAFFNKLNVAYVPKQYWMISLCLSAFHVVLEHIDIKRIMRVSFKNLSNKRIFSKGMKIVFDALRKSPLTPFYNTIFCLLRPFILED